MNPKRHPHTPLKLKMLGESWGCVMPENARRRCIPTFLRGAPSRLSQSVAVATLRHVYFSSRCAGCEATCQACACDPELSGEDHCHTHVCTLEFIDMEGITKIFLRILEAYVLIPSYRYGTVCVSPSVPVSTCHVPWQPSCT